LKDVSHRQLFPITSKSDSSVHGKREREREREREEGGEGQRAVEHLKNYLCHSREKGYKSQRQTITAVV